MTQQDYGLRKFLERERKSIVETGTQNADPHCERMQRRRSLHVSVVIGFSVLLLLGRSLW